MFAFDGDLFEIEENETNFFEICSTLQKHSFRSPWEMCFRTPENVEVIDKVFEFTLDSDVAKNISPHEIQNPPVNDICSKNSADTILAHDESDIDRETMYSLKSSLMEVQDANRIEQIKDLDILRNLPLSQMPVLSEVLDIPVLNETAMALLVNGILQMKTPISLAVATAFVQHFVYPKVCEVKSSSTRTLITAILNFSEIYPKATIDELVIPCLKKEIIEASQFEILFKMAKYNLPNEYVSSCIKSILDHALPAENTFSILQCLIERKAQFDQSLYDTLTRKMQVWTGSCNSNIKFTKLLTSILSVYGSELTSQQLLIYDDAIQSNKTIVKRAAENLIKKLKS